MGSASGVVESGGGGKVALPLGFGVFSGAGLAAGSFVGSLLASGEIAGAGCPLGRLAEPPLPLFNSGSSEIMINSLMVFLPLIMS